MHIKVIVHSKKKIIIYHLSMSTNVYNCTCHYIENNLVRVIGKEIKEHLKCQNSLAMRET